MTAPCPHLGCADCGGPAFVVTPGSADYPALTLCEGCWAARWRAAEKAAAAGQGEAA